jgi:hypothetical protein
VPPSILGWEDDPGAPGRGRHPSARPRPSLSAAPLPVSIVGKAPPAREFKLGTPEFRYWVAAEALARAAQFWGTLVPKGTRWQPSNGTRLPVHLDQDVDLNAYYDRNGLHFFHDTVKGHTVYSGESPDVVCHELGHAVLDGLRPQLWDALSAEIAAFHESFGDVSAMLSGLQLQSLREEVLAETASRLDRSSRLSCLAEQLGWAVRQGHPDAVDRDCLRNAANSFFYRDPIKLPPTAPASTLSSEPHSFSRVFTGAFLNVLAGMFRLQKKRDQAGLLDTARDAATILLAAIRATPVVPTYFSQIAAHMISADAATFGGRYRDALKSGFVRHGVLSLQAATSVPAHAPGAEDAPLARIPIPAAHLGLPQDLLVTAASHPKRFAVSGAAPDIGGTESPGHDDAAASFLEDLIRRGEVDFNGHAVPETAVLAPKRRKTHEVVQEGDQLVLVRRRIDCGVTLAA